MIQLYDKFPPELELRGGMYCIDTGDYCKARDAQRLLNTAMAQYFDGTGSVLTPLRCTERVVGTRWDCHLRSGAKHYQNAICFSLFHAVQPSAAITQGRRIVCPASCNGGVRKSVRA